MMQRLARDPVGQTVVFDLVMRLFFLHVLGVRPECLQNRRRASFSSAREWFADGVAASSIALGIFGAVLAYERAASSQLGTATAYCARALKWPRVSAPPLHQI